MTTRKKTPWSIMSLLDLMTAVVHGDTACAVEELACKRQPFLYGEDRMTCVDYICRLRIEKTGRTAATETSLWDSAHDLTVSKLTSVPNVVPTGQTESQIDCRNYYAALLKAFEERGISKGAANELQQEQLVGACYQGFVNRHFGLSFREALRNGNPFVSRYEWRLDGIGSIIVRMPKYISGNERRKWLEENVPDADPRRAGERERVQSIVNDLLVIPRFAPWDSAGTDQRDECRRRPDQEVVRNERPDFSRFLAREKAVSIRRQRPAIRKLGPQKIERLVLTILDNLCSPNRSEESIAEEFGLSKTALSHFAGSRWAQGDGSSATPDLYRNAAQLLGSELFRDAAADAGVLRAALEVSQQRKRARLRENSDA